MINEIRGEVELINESKVKDLQEKIELIHQQISNHIDEDYHKFETNT
jgi:hypothetical protein